LEVEGVRGDVGGPQCFRGERLPPENGKRPTPELVYHYFSHRARVWSGLPGHLPRWACAAGVGLDNQNRQLIVVWNIDPLRRAGGKVG
jgi:hypothetical protein